MKNVSFTPFGKDVKKRLVDIDKPQAWLIERLRKNTGMFVDGGYLYKILTGQRNAPKIVQAICEILDLPTEPDAT